MRPHRISMRMLTSKASLSSWEGNIAQGYTMPGAQQGLMLLISLFVAVDVVYCFHPTTLGLVGNKKMAQSMRSRSFATSLHMGPIDASFSRRNALKIAGGTLTASIMGAPLAAIAAPSSLSTMQSGIQDRLAPGHWFGQLLGVNCHQETWAVRKTLLFNKTIFFMHFLCVDVYLPTVRVFKGGSIRRLCRRTGRIDRSAEKTSAYPKFRHCRKNERSCARIDLD